MRRAVRVTALIALAIAAPAFGKGSSGGHAGSGHSGSHSSSHSSMHSGSGAHSSSRSIGSPSTTGHRGKHDHIKRNAHARSEFMHSHPCPSTGRPSEPCPGYAIGGGSADEPSTMMWQATAVPM